MSRKQESHGRWRRTLSATIAAAFGMSVMLNAAGVTVAQAPAVPESSTPAERAPSNAPAAGPTVEPAAPAAAMPAASPMMANLPRDLSPMGMFLNADIVVQAVMLGLLFASLVTWTVWLAKNIELLAAKQKAKRGVRTLQEARSLAAAIHQLGNGNDTIAKLVRAAGTEVRLSDNMSGEGLKERVAWLLERIEGSASRRVGRGMGVIATIGATAPFVGLFGTVWGIMNSFIGISNAHTTNLAVVAPGIAEALLATALGLFAAIPAVVIYNVFARSIGGYRALLGDASALVMRLVSRDSERGHVPLARAAE